MKDWDTMFRMMCQDAKVLRTSGALRSSVNRIYYAFYALVTARSRLRPPYNTHGWRNPEHSQIPGMISQIPGINAAAKDELRRAFKELYRDRIEADYHPWVQMTAEDVKDIFRTAYAAFALLGEKI